ncbi:aldehyde dehydrogenase family protein [Amycolatopsis sp. NPDC058278]|uniref:aldehyde dehydrogenase family protein n=1 Tax=Amycolatopsis sp. NPDC058278 TaxID=3346417 RepID=UPI0036DE730F
MTRTLDLTDPATGEVFGTSPIASQPEVDAALESAAQAFAIWRRSTPAHRQLALLKIADTLEARAAEFADLEVRETGKIRSMVLDEEIPECVSALRFFAGAARQLEGTAARAGVVDLDVGPGDRRPVVGRTGPRLRVGRHPRAAASEMPHDRFS